MQGIAPSLAALFAAALIGAVLTRWVNLALARLWALALLLAVIVLYVMGIVRGEARGGIELVVIANFLALPAFIGALAGSVLTEWRMRE